MFYLYIGMWCLCHFCHYYLDRGLMLTRKLLNQEFMFYLYIGIWCLCRFCHYYLDRGLMLTRKLLNQGFMFYLYIGIWCLCHFCHYYLDRGLMLIFEKSYKQNLFYHELWLTEYCSWTVLREHSPPPPPISPSFSNIMIDLYIVFNATFNNISSISLRPV